MHCPKCGAKIDDDAAFCEECGTKIKKGIWILLASFVFCVGFVIVLITVIIPNNKYNNAINLMHIQKYDEAIIAFNELDGYRESREKAEECLTEIRKINIEKIKSACVGDTIKFGAYDQDYDITNGKEEVEWLVLEKTNNAMLVISKKIIASQCYDYDRFNSVPWESSHIREWLNDTFLKECFIDKEKNMILDSYVNNGYYSNATTDKLFLLSIDEAEEYFPTNDQRKCQLTLTAFHDRYIFSDRCDGDYSAWWLRFFGDDPTKISVEIEINGEINYVDLYQLAEQSGVRPAMWLTIG